MCAVGRLFANIVQSGPVDVFRLQGAAIRAVKIREARPLTGWSARIGRTIGRLAIITGEAIPGSVIVTGFASKACRLASYVIAVAVIGPTVFRRESANDRLPHTLSFRPSP